MNCQVYKKFACLLILTSISLSLAQRNSNNLQILEDSSTKVLTTGESFKFNCTAFFNPYNVRWERRDGKDLESRGVKEENAYRNETHMRVSLIVEAAEERNAGDYVCRAWGHRDQREREIAVTLIVQNRRRTADASESVQQREASGGSTIWTVLTVVFITLLAVGVCLELRRRKNRHGLTKKQIELFQKGVPMTNTKMGAYAHENVMYQPYDFSYELDEDSLKIDTGNILGAGSYGVVYKGRYKDIQVAVKMTKPMSDKTYLRALLIELKVMIHIGKHPHINMVVGACSKDLGRGILKLVMELCANGNLETYLRSNRYKFSNQFRSDGVIEMTSSNSADPTNPNIATVDLLIWSWQIADAMEYLGSRHVIHGDLATRNVLLDANYIARVTDFGLARQMYDYANYVKRNQEPLPWRWMAIESLRELTFSPASDIWGYGVLLWELFTCGDIPYPGESWNAQFVDKLEGGYRLQRPKYSSKELYNQVMINCWSPNPKDRISFTVIKEFLEKRIPPNLR